MKKSLTFFLPQTLFLLVINSSFLFTSQTVYAQHECGIIHKDNSSYESVDPNDLFLDRFGNSYHINELKTPNGIEANCSPGYYNILVTDNEVTQDMEDVVCQVFSDISNIIEQRQAFNDCNEPLDQIPVNIEITTGATGNTAATATPFFAGWNTSGLEVNLGRAYLKINGGYLLENDAMDGLIRINKDINWHYDWTTSTLPGFTDLYSTILHEALHILGFSSTFFIGNSVFPENFITLWDQNLYATTNYVPGGGSPTPVSVVESNCLENEWEINSDIFLSPMFFDEAVFQNCMGNQTLDIVFGSNALAPISGGNGNSTTDLNSFRNMLSHSNNTCNGQNENYLMSPILQTENRVISQTELDILCTLGYKLNTCDGVFNIAHFDDRFPLQLDDLNDCCINDFYGCINTPLIIDGASLLCNDIGNGTSIEVTSIIEDGPLTVVKNGDSFEITSTEPGLFTMTYTISNDECKMHNMRFNLRFDLCPTCGNNPCNLSCVYDFQEFIDFNGANLGLKFRYIDTGSSSNGNINNTPDINEESNGNLYLHLVDFTTGNESVAIELSSPIKNGCSANISLDLATVEALDGELNVWGSETPPCSFVNYGCNADTDCDTYIYSPKCIATVDITNEVSNPIDFETYTINWPNNSGSEINYIILSPGGGTTAEVDNIIVQEQCGECNSCGCETIGTIGEETKISEITFPFNANCVTINGTLIIDQFTLWIGKDITMEAGAEIIVESPLIIASSTIKGCNEMWKGISVNPDAALYLDDSNISDAQYAIQALDGANLYITRNHFTNNFVSFYTPPGNHSLNVNAFSANEFISNTDYPLPYSGQVPTPGERSYAAIWLHGTTGLNIGNQGAPPNIISHVRNGIIIQGGAIAIDNVQIGQLLGASDEILNQSNLESNGINVQFCSNFLQTNCTISNCSYGTVASRSNITIIDNNYTGLPTQGVFYPIWAENQSNFVSTIIEDNTIDFRNIGIKVNRALFPNLFRIQGNTITDNHGGGGADWNGIDLFLVIDLFNASNNGQNIIENNTINEPRNAGMNINSCYGLNVMNNMVYPEAFGMKILGSQKCLFSENEVMLKEQNNQIGFDIRNTLNTNYCCNVLDAESNHTFSSGISFYGACNTTNLKGTQFIGNFDEALQLYFASNTIIGEQVRAGNIWSGNFNTAAAHHHGIFQDNVFASRFFVNSNVPNTLPPQNLIISAIDDWFTPSSGPTFSCPPATIDCELPAAATAIKLSDIKIAEGLPSSFKAAVRWHLERALVERIENNPQLLGTNPTIDQFYYQSDTKLKTFNQLENDIQSLYEVELMIQNSLTQNYNSTKQLMVEIKIKEDQIQNASSVDSVSLTQEKLALINNLSTKVVEFENIQTSAEVNRQNEASQLLSQNNSINTRELFEVNEKTVNEIFLTMIKDGSGIFTNDQIITLKTIAEQCPLDGGNAVFRARGILSVYGYTYNDDSCQTATLHSSNQESVLAQESRLKEPIQISPNPANREVVITITESEEKLVHLEVFNLYGSRVLLKELGIGSNKLDTSDLPEGIYLFRIQTNETNVITKKMIILH